MTGKAFFDTNIFVYAAVGTGKNCPKPLLLIPITVTSPHPRSRSVAYGSPLYGIIGIDV